MLSQTLHRKMLELLCKIKIFCCMRQATNLTLLDKLLQNYFVTIIRTLYNKVTLPLENFSLGSLFFSKIVKINIDSGLLLALFSFLVVQQMLFVELLLGQHLTLFVFLNQQLLTYNDFLYNHNLINIQ